MEVLRMSLLGMAITKKEKDVGTVYVEYHLCDKCGAEYRVYMKSLCGVEDAFRELAKRLGNKPHEQDLCFNCQNNVIAPQAVMSL
ncbi:MAG: hypothetical protein PHI12_06790 [Dehalococcoidales bacterium]|nr:hypothetical protein [Dehalococcoidales bacterium]